ncbi:MAG: hypothetical protein HOY69_26845 [Streptomyces sp.]|nr:hypothetical protein [Streptomyces sp.]
MPKTVRALALAALFVLGGAATAQASTVRPSTGVAGAAGATVVAASGTVVTMQGVLPCMAC